VSNEFHIRLNRRNITQDEILEDLRRVAVELHRKTVTKVQYDERGVYGATTVLRKLGTWNQALESSGLEIVNRQDIPNEELFENIANIWTKLGRQPFGREFNDKGAGSLFSLGTYERRFGSWNKALLAFSEYIQSRAVGLELNEPLDFYDQSSTTPRRSTPRKINWRLRAKILIKQSCICQMCGDSPSKNPDTVLHVDHILAWANGGETVEENLQTLCAICNIGKSDQLLPDQDCNSLT
jgi:Homing endonuclease associated repeat/HNH endonuclease